MTERMSYNDAVKIAIEVLELERAVLSTTAISQAEHDPEWTTGALRRCAQMADAIATLSNPWVKVSERLPDAPMAEEYLVCLENGRRQQAIFWPEKHRRYWTWKGERLASTVTHWQPLPPAPEPDEATG